MKEKKNNLFSLSNIYYDVIDEAEKKITIAELLLLRAQQ